jgi:two-component system, OmpR family, heavy metal sensor histidine kinase CusS
MRSIRLSLLGYFLVLLAAALGAVSFLVYQITQETLRDKQAKARELVEAKNAGRIQEQRDKLDRDLLQQAWGLSWRVRSQFDWYWSLVHRVDLMNTIAQHAANMHNGGAIRPPNSMFHALDNDRGAANEWLLHLVMSKMHLDEDKLHPDSNLAKIEFFQIDSEWGNIGRSHSLGDRSLPRDEKVTAVPQAVYWERGDVELDSDLTLRRFTLKVPVVGRFRPPGGGGGGGGGGGRMPRNPLDPPPPPEPSSRLESRMPVMFIQTASTTTERDKGLAKIQAEIDEEVADLETKGQETLTGLRKQLLIISGITFAASVLGGFALVWLGLRPLNRLSEAVSRVSTKDFRLPLDDSRPLPNELQPIAERLTQTLAMLKRAFAREKQAAADISHELRTPLAALMTTLEVGLKKPRSPEEYRELLEDCRLSGQQMSRLVERLLALARLDAGVDTLRTQQVDVSGLAEQCAAVVRPLADARGVTLRVHRNGPTTMQADPNKLSEVVTNLLHNAIQYNRPSGSIDLTVERENGHVKLEVRDTGIGIGPEARTHIFERFYRADPSRHTDGQNAGLGLAIVKGYVDLMGGTIAVESNEGVGSTFRVELPMP